MTSKHYLLTAGLCLTSLAFQGCETPEEAENVRRGAAVGALGGALLGAGMGALAGDGDFIVAGAAAGAMYGAATGALYEYDQNREDRRTRVLAEAIGGAKAGETADSAGQRHLADFIGDWSLSIWEMTPDGRKASAEGECKAVMDGRNQLTFNFDQVQLADGKTSTSGTARILYDDAKGFSLVFDWDTLDSKLVYYGEYIPASDSYEFYFANNDGDTSNFGKDGTLHTSVRLTLRATGQLLIADSYSLVDGKETQTQSYRFTRQ
ncbi:hypothetical protein [Coraliomargarita akajimensis]|uniref:Glycine zipper domain-containing protein n=1 Tax=Coraliomargarita akajimensis (strain DSM 45221 / IAM 15411 / JCM 23193 / KCTC 12865 / 04OKA010-24) TaxID=583355 RepID=D5EKX9_CORAD|nr:hypothetical protein [Coraliomargarita akajimensis]ADE53081.1 conserved hypothetical protein [Coraliomargarita akajimensis DSM 45221]